MKSDAQLDAFITSLDDTEPPPALSGPLLGVWRALRGEWQAAHDAVQEDTTDCSWVHAALHREEGDHSNASYWYRRATRPTPATDTRTEYLAIAKHLLDR